MDIWVEGATRIPSTDDDGAGFGTAKKVIWHTTETDAATTSPVVIARALNVARSQCHIVWNPVTGEIVQMLPANTSSRALENASGGVQTNKDGEIVLQIEVCGYAAQPFTDGPMVNFDKLQAFIRQLGIPDVWPAGQPPVSKDGYGLDTKFRSIDAWGNSGHFGHSQVPENRHSDPGNIDQTKITGGNMATRTYNGVTLQVTTRQGWTLDVRTAEYFDSVNAAMPGGVLIIQGSYSKAVAASAGTHDGPGALDLKPASAAYRNDAGYRQLESISREHGGAAWFRPWANNYHVHIIVIGTQGLNTICRNQVASYLNGHDGLVSNLRISGVINTTFEKWKSAVLNIGAAVSDNAKIRLLQQAVRQTMDGNWGEQTDIDLRNTRAEALVKYNGTYFNKWNPVQKKRMQKSWGAFQDGIWGAATAAWAKKTVIDIQRALNVPADGVWGPMTDNAYNILRAKSYKAPAAAAPVVKPVDWTLPFTRGGPANFYPYPGKVGASYYGPSKPNTAWYSGRVAGGNNQGTWASGNLMKAVINDRIKKIQKCVNVPQDGIYGPTTVNAVKTWQAAHKLPADGIVGPTTWRAMAASRGQ